MKRIHRNGLLLEPTGKDVIKHAILVHTSDRVKPTSLKRRIKKKNIIFLKASISNYRIDNRYKQEDYSYKHKTGAGGRSVTQYRGRDDREFNLMLSAENAENEEPSMDLHLTHLTDKANLSGF